MKKKTEHQQPSKAQIAAAEAQIIEQAKRIDFYLTEYSVELLAIKVQSEEFVVPDYQREFTWEPERKSKFIESLIMGLPIPFLFFWEMPNGNLEIVDGSQRLRTISEFIFDNFCLNGLESLTALNGFCFNHLPESRQRKIKNRSIRGIVLNEHADKQARFDMFERINTGSKIANKAEIRRGALDGPFMDFVIELAKNPEFSELTPISESLKKQREHEELVTRFFAYSDSLDGYKDKPSEFLFNYVDRMNKIFGTNPEIADEYRLRFNTMISFVKKTFPFGFRRTNSKEAKASPRSRFEAIAIGSWLALKENPDIANKDIDVTSWHFSKEFGNITGADGANARARLMGRMDFVKNRLLGSE